jgi:hypothetical protein
MPGEQNQNQPCAQAKAQPWKSHWPPATAKETSGVEYGVEKGKVIVVDGTSAKTSPPKREASGEMAMEEK